VSAQKENVSRFGSLEMAINKLRTAQPAAVALVLGKLCGLGRVNSSLGYAAGDKAIENFYARLNAIARTHDIALEVSGPMFALLIHAPLHEGHVLLAANKITVLVRESIECSHSTIRLDVAMGAAMLPDNADSPALLIERAEMALRNARETGETLSFWRPDAVMPQGSACPHPLFDAQQAIDNGEFRVFFQPKIELCSNTIVGAEALVRWHGPDGLVAPASFLAEIERKHAMAPLLHFVMNTAAREMARWLRRLPGMSIAVNSTASDLDDGDFVELIAEVLGLWSLDPRHLVLEITETTLMRNPAASIETLQALRELGVRTSIDDFGTGYSSLAYLKDLPVDELKIDRSFVQRICTNPVEREIVATIIKLGQAMGIRVVAEGIESAAIAQELKRLGCDLGQGYYFGKPVSGRDFERHWLNGSGAAAISSS
jgi:diguanylate cyclase (GGDEF)-like protein